MMAFVKWLCARYDRYEMRILSGQQNAGTWRRIVIAIGLVSIYWVGAALIFIVTLSFSLLFSSTIPLAVGGTMIALVALLQGFFVRPDDRVLATVQAFSRRLRMMRVGRYADRAETVDGFLTRENVRSRPLRRFVTATSIVLFIIGVLITIESELLLPH